MKSLVTPDERPCEAAFALNGEAERMEKTPLNALQGGFQASSLLRHGATASVGRDSVWI